MEMFPEPAVILHDGRSGFRRPPPKLREDLMLYPTTDHGSGLE